MTTVLQLVTGEGVMPIIHVELVALWIAEEYECVFEPAEGDLDIEFTFDF